MDKLISVNNYEFKSWKEKYPDHKINLKSLYIHSDWSDFFENIFKDERFSKIENHLELSLNVTKGKVKMYPYPDLLFSALNTTPLNRIKVVIIGQDPYHNNEKHNNKIIPQAMGMSFSVPKGITIPSSLRNIYANMKQYKHQYGTPTHGNLEFWTYQGVLMLNTALTVQHGHPNSHAKYWTWLTDKLIEYISNETDHIVFVLWGKQAYNKIKLIDKNKHKIVASSHPSGLSYNKKMGSCPPFKEQDHFGLVNKYLRIWGKEEIIWNII